MKIAEDAGQGEGHVEAELSSSLVYFFGNETGNGKFCKRKFTEIP